MKRRYLELGFVLMLSGVGVSLLIWIAAVINGETKAPFTYTEILGEILAFSLVLLGAFFIVKQK